MDPIQTIIAILGGQAVLLAVGAWLARSFMAQVLARELEKFKAELSREAALSIERIKHDLQIQAHQKQTMFTRIHELRMEAVARIYSGLLSLYDAAMLLVQDDVPAGSDEWKERYQQTLDAMRQFRADIRLWKLYLPRQAAEQLMTVVEKIEGLLVAVGVPMTGGRASGHWSRFDDQLRKMLPTVCEVLENEFQALLGVTSDKEPNIIQRTF